MVDASLQTSSRPTAHVVNEPYRRLRTRHGVRSVWLLLVLVWVVDVAWAVPGERFTVSGRILSEGSPARVHVRGLVDLHRLGEQQWGERPAGRTLVDIRTTASGDFEIQLPAGFWRLEVRGDGYLPMIFDLEPLLESRRLPTLVMTPRRHCEVRLLDVEGAPLEHQEVTAYGWSRRWRSWSQLGWWPAQRTVRSDHAGRLRVPWDGAEKLRLTALWDAGYLHEVVTCVGEVEPGDKELGAEGVSAEAVADVEQPEVTPSEETPPKSVEVTPSGRWQWRRVVDAFGAPVSGVWGFFRWPLLAFGRSDRDGMLRTPEEDASAPLWLADADGLYGAPVPDALQPPSSTTGRGQDADEVWMLPRTVWLHGRLSDVLSTAPVSGGWAWSSADVRYRVLSDGEGLFRLRLAEDDGHRLQFAAAGFSRLEGPKPQEVADGLLDVRLTPTRPLTGRITDTAGQPLAEVDVRLQPWPPGNNVELLGPAYGPRASAPAVSEDEDTWKEAPWTASTDVEGRFVFRGLDATRLYRLRLRKEGFRQRAVEVDLIAQGSEILDLVMGGARRAHGRVLDTWERPIAGATVQLVPAEPKVITGWPDGPRGASTTSDEAGRFLFMDPPNGAFFLAARAPDHPELLVPGIEIEPDAEEIPLGDLLLAPGQRLYGWVRSADGIVEGAQISLRKSGTSPISVQRQETVWFANGRSDGEGYFEFDGLPRDAGLTMILMAEGFLSEQLEIRLEDRPKRLDVELKQGGGLRGQVLDLGGVPHGGAGVLAWAPQLTEDSDLSHGRSWAYTAPDGRFDLGRVSPGEFLVSAASEVGVAATRAMRIEADDVQEVTLQLKPWGGLQGRLVDGDGVPVADAEVQLQHLDDIAAQRPGRHTRDRTRSDVHGEFVLPRIMPGHHRVHLRHANFESRSVDIDMGHVQQRVEWQVGARRTPEAIRTVSGWTLDVEGTPCRGAVLSLLASGGAIVTKSGADGAFRLEAEAGVYRLAAQHGTCGVHGGQDVDLTDGDHSGVVLELSSSAVLRGQVEGLSFEQLSHLQVTALSGLEQRYGTFDHEGRFRIEGLAPGRWQVRATLLSPRRLVRQHVELEQGETEAWVTLRFEAGSRLTGVALLDGLPVVDGVATLSCASGFQARIATGTDGGFAFSNVPEGGCRIKVKDPRSAGRFEASIEIDGDMDLRCDLAP